MTQTWRVGRTVGRTIYLNDALVGVMDTPELAAQAVAALESHDTADYSALQHTSGPECHSEGLSPQRGAEGQ